SMLASTRLSPYDLLRPWTLRSARCGPASASALSAASAAFMGAMGAASQEKDEELGQEVVRDQDHDRGGDHRVGRRAANAVGAAGRAEAVVAADDGDEVGEEERLADAADHVRDGQVGEDVVVVRGGRHLELEDGDQQAAGDADRVAQDG